MHRDEPVIFTFHLAGPGKGYGSSAVCWGGTRSKCLSWDVEHKVRIGHTGTITTHSLACGWPAVTLDTGLYILHVQGKRKVYRKHTHINSCAHSKIHDNTIYISRKLSSSYNDFWHACLFYTRTQTSLNDNILCSYVHIMYSVNSEFLIYEKVLCL